VKKGLLFLTLAVFLLVFFSIETSAKMVSDNYRTDTSVISSGGASMSSISYQTNMTLGQSSTLLKTGSEDYGLYPGFWYTLDTYWADCLWDLEPSPPDGDVDGSDFAEFVYGFELRVYGEAEFSDFAVQFGKNDCID